MKVYRDFQQGSLEWMIARAGIPTASEFDQLVTPLGKIRTGGMPETYLSKKLAEAWIQGPLPGFGTFQTEQGQILESEALPWYELEYTVTVDRVGFITTDDGRAGCSPDGLIAGPAGQFQGLEVKCPEVHTHVRYLLDGELPEDYRCQVQGAMLVTGAPSWRFLSYRRGLPALVLTVPRDEALIAVMREALARFAERFDAGMARLVELNGGPPPKRKPFVPSRQETRDPDDIIP